MTAADHTPRPATGGLREAIEALAADFRSEIDWSNGRSNYGDNEAWEQAARRVDDILAAHPAPPSQTCDLDGCDEPGVRVGRAGPRCSFHTVVDFDIDEETQP